MPAIEYLSWNGDGATVLPHRPSTDNLGGDDLQDDEAAPPAPGDPNAPSWNAKVRETVALAKTAAPAKFTITFNAGAPQWELFSAAGSVVTGDLTLTDVGTGVTEITWPANTFPPAAAWPELTWHAAGRGFIEVITNGVRVTMVNAAGSAADIPFTVTVN
jgi:hypothetical protein